MQTKPVHLTFGCSILAPLWDHLNETQPGFPRGNVACAQLGCQDVELDEEGTQKAGNDAHDDMHGQLPDVVEVALAIQRKIVIIQPAYDRDDVNHCMHCIQSWQFDLPTWCTIAVAPVQ